MLKANGSNPGVTPGFSQRQSDDLQDANDPQNIIK